MSEHLLSIDVAAALKKLALGRLRNRNQSPVALARVAANAQAANIEIDVGRSDLKLEHNGRTLSQAVVSALGDLLSESNDDRAKYHALVRLEESGMLDLLVAFGQEARLVELNIAAPISKKVVLTKGGQKLKISHSNRRNGLQINISGAKRNRSAEVSELKDALRFATFSATVNGKQVCFGPRLQSVFIKTEVEQGGLRALVGIPTAGLAAVTYFLKNGVIEQQVWESPENGFVFEAIVDGQHDSTKTQAVALAHQVAARLYQTATRGYREFSAAERFRLKQLLYRLADYGAGCEVVRGIALFRRIDGQLVSSEYLRQAALGRLLRAIGPQARLERYQLSQNVFVLDEQDRAFIEKHMRLVVREPGRVPRPKNTLVQLFSKIKERLRISLTRLRQRLSAARRLPVESLEQSEAEFLQALSEVLSAGFFHTGNAKQAALAKGRFGSFYRLIDDESGRTILLLRHHKQVRQMIKSFEQNPLTLYATFMLLAEGQAAFDKEREQALEQIIGFSKS
jgi:hypothetical protein